MGGSPSTPVERCSGDNQGWWTEEDPTPDYHFLSTDKKRLEKIQQALLGEEGTAAANKKSTGFNDLMTDIEDAIDDLKDDDDFGTASAKIYSKLPGGAKKAVDLLLKKVGGKPIKEPDTDSDDKNST